MLNNQSAYYYNGKTYIVYSGTNCNPYIICYDHDTDKYSDIVKLGVTVSIEYHVVPSLLIDNEGYIHVFFGAHNYVGNLTYIRSSGPEDISQWIEMGEMSFERGVSYLQSMQMKDDSICVRRESWRHQAPPSHRCSAGPLARGALLSHLQGQRGRLGVGAINGWYVQRFRSVLVAQRSHRVHQRATRRLLALWASLPQLHAV